MSWPYGNVPPVLSALLSRSHGGVFGRRRRVFAQLLVDPKSVVFLCPIDIDGTAAHRLKRTLHADGADVDVPEHGGDKQHGNDPVYDLGSLHALDVRAVEWEHEDIAADRHRSAPEHHDPVDRLLAAVETIGRGMVMPHDEIGRA